MSWTNVAMFVRGMPSISACSITTEVESDWMRKIVLLSLALASTTTSTTSMVLTLFGISMACVVLLANLGSRAWRYNQWRPLGYGGPFEPVVSYVAAMIAGLVVPWLGHPKIEAGGKAAMESVIRIAFAVAVLFALSDYTPVQQYLVIGSEVSRQGEEKNCFDKNWNLSFIHSFV